MGAAQAKERSAASLSSQGCAKLERGQYERAVKDFDEAITLEPEEAVFFNNRGLTKCKLGQYEDANFELYEDAVKDFDEAIRLKPDAFFFSNRGDAKFRLGQYEDAVKDFDEAIRLNPEDADDFFFRGSAKMWLGQFTGISGAIQDFDTAIRLNPENAWFFYHRANARLKAGQFERATKDYEQVIRLQPPSFSFRRALPRTGEVVDEAGVRHRFEQLRMLADDVPSMDRAKSWAVIGAGPVGLALALKVAELMRRAGWSQEEAHVTVYEVRIARDGEGHPWRRTGRRRGQVVTLQDDVVNLWPPGTFEGERVWPTSRNVAIRDLEDKLLEKAAQHPYIRIEQAPRHSRPADQRSFIKGLKADMIVAADGAVSLSRQAFPETFRSLDAPEGTDRTRLGDTCDEYRPVEYALGVSLKDDPNPRQGLPQSHNVLLTLSQNRFLLNSQRGKRGFLNIRLTEKEYMELFEATAKKGCAFGSPVILWNDFAAAAEEGLTRVNLDWLTDLVKQGLEFYGLQERHAGQIVGIQLAPAYVQRFFHVLEGGKVLATFRRLAGLLRNPQRKRFLKVLALVGDAAMSHHFWPGRGLDTGLKSADALVRAWWGGDLASQPRWAEALPRLVRFQHFMEELRLREMQGRSGSMMRVANRLPDFIINDLIQPGTLRDAAIDTVTVLEGVNQQAMLENAKGWRDFLERHPNWPHQDQVSDKDLEDILINFTTAPRPLAMHIMAHSACDNGPGRARGWPTSQQGGREVNPAD